MLTFIVIGAVVPIKFEFTNRYDRSLPRAVSLLALAAVVVMACLAALLVTWWTTFPWGAVPGGWNDALVVAGSVVAIAAYVFCVVIGYASLADSNK